MVKLLNLGKIGDEYEMCLYDASYGIIFEGYNIKAGKVICLLHFIYSILKIEAWKKVVLNDIDEKIVRGQPLTIF